MFLIAFFARELAPSRRRIFEAARNATKTTLTAGLAASMQILGPFGPLFAFRIGQPGISLGLFEGAVTIVCAAAMQAAIVPITGKLLDYPGLILAFLFLVFAMIAYLLSNTRLFLPLALVAVGTITTMYVGIFEPGQIGWGSAYTFDGILMATLVMVAIDSAIWPSSPEPRLLESIATDLARTRRRFKQVGQRYLDPFSAQLPAPLAQSRLTPNLVLLKSVEEHARPTSRRLAALLNAVMIAEHAYLEVERLAVLADEPVADEVRHDHGEEIELALKILDTAFSETSNDILAGLPESENSAEWVSDLGLMIRRLDELSVQTLPASDESTAFESLNFLEFVGGLTAIADLLEPRERSRDSTAAAEDETPDDRGPHLFIDPARFRFSVKLGAAITLGLLVGLTTQRADLQTILWSIAVAGQPNQYGAVVRKTILRLAGCIVGGLATLATMLIVSQNFDSLPPYLVAIFAVTMFATYVAQSSEWLGYAGIQAGITFLICYVGLSPASDIYRPLWRFWGIVLGVLTTGFVFLFLWPEYASDKVIESLANLIRTTLAFGKEVAEKNITEGRVAAVERRLSANLFEVLNLADQARLEGRRGSANSAAAIEAAATVIRIAYRYRIVAHARLAGAENALSQEFQQRCIAMEREFCAVLESQVEKCDSISSAEEPATSTPRPSTVDSQLRINERTVIHSDLAAQLESYRRLPILLASLDTALSKIEGS